MLPLPTGRVLIVDDNEDLAYLLAELISMMGYKTLAVTSVAAALDVLPDFSPDVIFSDIGMPGVSGYEFARTIMRTISSPPLLISVSGWNDINTVKQSYEAGFKIHLGKPVLYPDVQMLLRNYFQSNEDS